MSGIVGDSSYGNLIFQIAFVSAVLMLVFFKGRRAFFVIPSFLLFAVIINPVFKNLWENTLHFNYYWRVLWIVPVIPLCAALPAMISERTENKMIKTAIAVLFALLFIFTGMNVYRGYDGSRMFRTPADNVYKLPQDTIDVADALLDKEEHPRAVVDPAIGMYIRQYSGNISILYGRDVLGYIMPPDDDTWSVYGQLSSEAPDLAAVREVMERREYRYLVIRDDKAIPAEGLKQNGFELMQTVSGWNIYTLT